MLNDELINAVIQMRGGAWTDEEIADDIIRLYPNLGFTREEVIARVTDHADRRDGTEEFDKIVEYLYAHRPDIIAAMKEDRTLVLGEALQRFGLIRKEPKH